MRLPSRARPRRTFPPERASSDDDDDDDDDGEYEDENPDEDDDETTTRATGRVQLPLLARRGIRNLLCSGPGNGHRTPTAGVSTLPGTWKSFTDIKVQRAAF